jgi:hypothetical protein
MAKKKTKSYALQPNWPAPFRRTVRLADREPYLLVFEPGEHYELDPDEIEFLAHEIAVGVLVESKVDASGNRPVFVPPSAEDAIARLETQIEELSAENAELRAELEKATASV